MKRLLLCCFCIVLFRNVNSYKYDNETLQPVQLQLVDFMNQHPEPIGVMTVSAGSPVDIRETYSLNSDYISNKYNLDIITHFDAERIPERVVHAKGTGGYGYFEVTNDVSEYTSAYVFNGIGKKTPAVARFSSSLQNKGGVDLSRETKGMAIKLYTRDGNLDLLGLHIPVFFIKDPVDFPSFIHCFKRNPKTFLFDRSMTLDMIVKRPVMLNAFLWSSSDYGIPRTYREMDNFMYHVYELTNKHGESHFVRFNFRTEQGLANFTTEEAQNISGRDPDYYIRDLNNAIEEKQYPSWRLDMDVMTLDEILNSSYDPFDVSRLWKKGTYRTVTIGRLVVDKNVDNVFKDLELGAFNPANLVPGVPGPVDILFKGRMLSYKDTQNYRLGANMDKIPVNMPKYMKTYNRNGLPPVNDNMKDAPNYYPNSFDGPLPFVDRNKPKRKLMILHSTAVDLEQPAEFYKKILKTNGERQRLADNLVGVLETVVPLVRKNFVTLLSLTDEDLYNRVVWGLKRVGAVV